MQFLIEDLFATHKAEFQGHPAIRPELDLVDPGDEITHEIDIVSVFDQQTCLDVFRPDPDYLENEKKYQQLSKSILGQDSKLEDEEDESESESEQMEINDETETDVVNLRRTIYLTIMFSLDFDEAGHKLLDFEEMEVCIMLIECCSQERTYRRYYALLAQRLCIIKKVHKKNFEKCFVQQYSTTHRLETNRLRNVASFFAHLLATDALPWDLLSYIRLTEDETTSSSRIFVKILFQEMCEFLGIALLNEPALQDSYESSIFPRDNPRNTRFAINFFTSIGLGGLTQNLRRAQFSFTI